MERSAERILGPLGEGVPPLLEEEGTTEPRELSFGQYLRRERMLRGISTAEIRAVTKVSEVYLDALEEGRFEALPPKAFVCGFLRVFAKYAGLRGDDVVNRYLASLAQKEAFEESARKNVGFWRRHLRFLLGVCGAVSLLACMFAPLLR